MTWKRAGFVVPGGIHLHESPALLAAIRGRDAADVAKLTTEAALPAGCKAYPHGDVAFVLIPSATSEAGGDLPECVRVLKQLAGQRPIGAELVLDDWSESDFLAAKQRLGDELAQEPRLLVTFHGGEAAAHAARFAASLNEANAYAAASCVLVEGLQRRKRVAVLALRQGASVTALDGRELEAQGYFWFLEPPRQKGQPRPTPPVLDDQRLARELSQSLGQAVQVEGRPDFYRGGSMARVTTTEPACALAAMVAAAGRFGTQINPWLRDVDPYGFLLRRLLSDLRE